MYVLLLLMAPIVSAVIETCSAVPSSYLDSIVADSPYGIDVPATLSASNTSASRLAKTILAGVRVATAADVVLSRSLNFQGSLAPGFAKPSNLVRHINDKNGGSAKDTYTLMLLPGSTVKYIIDAYITLSLCSSNPNNGLFLQVSGLTFTFAEPNCAANTIFYCYRWLLSSPFCQKWAVFDVTERYLVALDRAILTDGLFDEVFVGAPREDSDVTLVRGILLLTQMFSYINQTSMRNVNAAEGLVPNLTGAYFIFFWGCVAAILLFNIIACFIQKRKLDHRSRIVDHEDRRRRSAYETWMRTKIQCDPNYEHGTFFFKEPNMGDVLVPNTALDASTDLDDADEEDTDSPRAQEPKVSRKQLIGLISGSLSK